MSSDINSMPYLLICNAIDKLSEIGEEEEVPANLLRFIGALICNAGALRAGGDAYGLDSFSNDRETIRTPEGTIVLRTPDGKREISARHAHAVERGWLDADARWGAEAWGATQNCYRW